MRHRFRTPFRAHPPRWALCFPLALLLLGGTGRTPSAEGGECMGCPEPSVSSIIESEGISLASRPPASPFSGPVRDYVEIDAGDCFFKVSGGDEAERIASWLVLRAYGEVWNCPHSKSSTTISAGVSTEDRTSWEVAETVDVKLDLGVVKAGHSLKKNNGSARGIKETSDLSTTLQAQACRRIPWLAYLRVARYRVEVTVAMIQPYAWWTKNPNTGPTVHEKGTYEQECLSATVPFERKAPLAWHLRLAEFPCDGCGGLAPKDLGWWPKLPAGGERPAIPDDLGWPELPTDPLPDPGNGWPAPEPEEEGVVKQVEPNGLPPEAEPWHVPPVG